MSLPEEGEARANAADKLLGLESRQPGQNVFAQREIAHHRQLLQGNAWYQAAYLEKLRLPASTIHPAFRTPGLSLDTSLPIPRMPMPPEMREAQRHRRESSGTTMSPFLNAGQQMSPELNLCTTPEHTPRPTQRAWLEDRAEYRHHEALGSAQERIPVFHHEAQLASGEPGSAATTKKSQSEVKFADVETTTYSPKKKPNIFRRLRGKRVANTVDSIEQGQRVPVKAEAVLGTKDSSTSGAVRRSTSKKKIFSRRLSDTTSTRPVVGKEQNRPATSMGFRSGASRNSSQSSQRRILQTILDHKDPATRSQSMNSIARAQSLKYADATAPPTPPSKDTPPDVKAIRDGHSHTDAIVTFSNPTPTRTNGFLSNEPGLSPTKSGSYGTRRGPQIISVPSMHSLHASIHINNLPQEARDELKSMEALGITGWNDERSPSQGPYSPSVYSQVNSPNGFRNSISHFPRSETIHEQADEDDEIRQDMVMIPHEPLRESMHTDDTTCTSQTIHVYRDLETDDSITDFMRYDDDSIFSASTSARAMAHADSYARLDGSQSPPKLGMRGQISTSIGDDGDQHDQFSTQMSPVSHPSALVSPLQPRAPPPGALAQVLVTPQPRTARRKAMDGNEAELLSSARYREHEDSPTLKGAAVFANKPILTPNTSRRSKQHRSPSQPTKANTQTAGTPDMKTVASAIIDSGVEPQQPKKSHKPRVSTSYAHNFYTGSPPSKDHTRTPTTEADTIIEISNPPAENFTSLSLTSSALIAHDQSTDEQHSPIHAEPTMSAMEKHLMAIIEKQNHLMTKMSHQLDRLQTRPNTVLSPSKDITEPTQELVEPQAPRPTDSQTVSVSKAIACSQPSVNYHQPDVDARLVAQSASTTKPQPRSPHNDSQGEDQDWFSMR